MASLMLLVRQRDFALAWLGGLVSMAGSWALWIALPIHVYELTGSALATSGVAAALIAPGILLGSVAGVYVDRWNRKTTLVVSNVLLAVATLPLAAADTASRLWLVYPLVVVSAVIAQFVGPAEHALLPRLVPPDDLVAANALNALNNSLARLLGPVLGGGLVAAAGLAGVVVADAASFLVAAALLGVVRASGAVDGGAAAPGAGRSMRREWRDGLELVRRDRALAVVSGVAAVTALGEGVFGVMFVVWVRDVLEGGAPEVGWLQTSQAVGGLLGGAAGAYVGARLVPERLFGLGLLAFGVLDLALFNHPLVVDALAVGMGLMVLVGIPGVWATAARATILQTRVADAYRGRVFGALATGGAVLMLAGTAIAGASGNALGPIVLLNLQGGAYVAAGLLVLWALAPRARAAQPDPAPAP